MTDYLVTTAIAYVNGIPHIGHVYEALLASFIKELYNLKTYNVKLLTGTDEHGKKIQQTAEKHGIDPIDLCDRNSAIFKRIYDQFGIKYDYFIRTTMDKHKQIVAENLNIAHDNGNIYKSTYSGYYDITEESFITQKDALKNDYINPLSKVPYIFSEEIVYKLKLIKTINNMCIPTHFGIDERTNNIIDIPISRNKTNVHWGITLPFDIDHVTYVWFDALLNYITGCDMLFDTKTSASKYVPKIIHVIGKDIVWFHTVIYQSILTYCNILEYMPYKIVIHGHVVDSDGKKMSKSLGNGIQIETLLGKYSLTSIKYYLISSTIFGEDFKFDENNLLAEYNILLHNYGNLFQRLYKLIMIVQEHFNDYTIEKVGFNDDIEDIITNFLNDYNMIKYKNSIFSYLKLANTSLTENKIWENTIGKINILFDTYLLFHKASYLLYPIIPEDISRIYSYFNILEITNKIQTVKIDTNKKYIAFNKLFSQLNI